MVKVLDGGNETRFVYGENGRLAATQHANKTITVYTYDGAGRVTWIVTNDPNSGYVTYSGYAYDSNGNVTSITTPEGTTTYAYDTLNRLISETSPSGQTTEYSYDSVGNRTEVRVLDPNGAVLSDTTFNYDWA